MGSLSAVFMGQIVIPFEGTRVQIGRGNVCGESGRLLDT